MKTRTRIAAAIAAGIAATTGLAGGAQAAPRTTVVYTTEGDLPADFAVSHGALAFLPCTEVVQVPANGGRGSVPGPDCGLPYAEPGRGVAYSPDGKSWATAFTIHAPIGGPSGPGYSPTETYSIVQVMGAQHVPGYFVDSEKTANPDGGATYGTSSSSSCVQTGLGTDASYSGRVLSRLSAVAAGPSRWYVADRAGNTIYRFDDSGRTSIVAVLPPVKVTVSQALASTLGWPSCVVGTKVAFEASPDDVEVAPDGSVYVAGLPALASGKLADRSVIYKINPRTGKIKTLSQRYAGVVDLAVGKHGRLFVAQRAAEKVSVIKHGRSTTYLKLPKVLAVETDERGRLYAAQSFRTGADPQHADVVRVG